MLCSMHAAHTAAPEELFADNSDAGVGILFL